MESGPSKKYEYTVVYRAGNHNTNMDPLSDGV